MSQPIKTSDPNREARRARSRLRLLLLFVVYPLYKTVDYFARNEIIQGIIMAVISIVYFVGVIYILASKAR